MLKLLYNKEDHIHKQELNKAISSQINNKENCDFPNINRKKSNLTKLKKPLVTSPSTLDFIGSLNSEILF